MDDEWAESGRRASRRTWAVAFAVLLGVCTLRYVVRAPPPPARDSIDDSGSPELALRWAAVLGPLPDPEGAAKADPEVQGRRFDNGEWAFGLCRNSHYAGKGGGGGTLVLKDSRGRVRASFGHVCGPRFLEAGLEEAKSLDDFYDRCLPKWEFKEFALP